MGLIACFMLPMVCHMPVVMQSPLDWVMHPETMLQIISEYKCTLAWMPNFAFQFVPRRTPQSRWAQYDLSSVRALINCSEPVRASSMHEFQNAFADRIEGGALQSSYAMAENVFAVTQSDISRIGARRVSRADGQQFRGAHRIVPVADGTSGAVSFISSGRLLPNHEVRIVSDSGAILSDGHVGEILVKSDCLFDGLLQPSRPHGSGDRSTAGTAPAILASTSTTNSMWSGGKKDLLIIGGENIYPQDIEEIAAGHPAIHDGRVIAMGVYNPDLGTEDIVVVAEVESEDLLANAAEIEREIRSRVVCRHGRGGSDDFPEAAKMDCEKHGRQRRRAPPLARSC